MSQLREYRTNQSLFRHNNTSFFVKIKIFGLVASGFNEEDGKKQRYLSGFGNSCTLPFKPALGPHHHSSFL